MIARHPFPQGLTPGNQRPSRRIGLAIGKKLFCPNRHHLREDAVFLHESGALRCKHKTPAPGRQGHLGECGVWLLVIMPGPAAPHEEQDARIRIVAEVTIDELREIQRRNLQSIEAMAAFLGISWAA